MCGSDAANGKQKWFYIVQVTKNMDEDENAGSQSRNLLDNLAHDVTKYMQYAQKMSGFMSEQIGDLMNPSIAPSAEIDIWPSETSKILNSDPSTLSSEDIKHVLSSKTHLKLQETIQSDIEQLLLIEYYQNDE